MAKTDLTEAKVRALALGSKVTRDSRVKGFMVICNIHSKSYAAQADLRRDRRLIRTVRVMLGRTDQVSLSDARAAAQTALASIKKGIDPVAKAKPVEAQLTLEQALDLHLAEHTLAPVTVKGYRRDLMVYLKAFASRPVADISRQDVREMKAELIEAHGLASTRHALRSLSAVLSTAMRHDAIAANPITAVQLPTIPQRKVLPLDLVEWWKVTESVFSPIRRDLHRLILFTGLRRTSAVTIKREHVDLEARVIRVAHMKSGRPFTLPLSTFLVDMLRKRMADDVPFNSRWLFPSPTSASGHTSDPKEHGLIPPHALRHVYKTLSFAAGIPHAESAMLLDQKLPGVSAGYIHVDHLVEHLRPYQEKMSAYLLNQIEGKPI
jgi:integrase